MSHYNSYYIDYDIIIVPCSSCAVSVTVSIKVVSRRERTYTVTCRATGGRLSSSSLTGPGLGSGLSLQRIGSSSDRGQNTYSRSSDTLSADVGAVYTCNATNAVSSPQTTLVLTGIGIRHYRRP